MPSRRRATVIRLGRRAWLVARLMICAAVLLPRPAGSAELLLQPAGAPQSEERSNRELFGDRLHKFAKQQAGQDRARYFALVRRGMDRFDELAAQAGDPDEVRSAQIDLASLGPAPTEADSSPNAQHLTTLRVGIAFDAEIRIVNGFPLREGQYEEVVALTGNGFICSGIALDGKHVLTAAHCACDLGLVPGHNTDPSAKIKVGLRTDGPTVKQRFGVKIASTQIFPKNAGFSCGNIETQIRSGRLDLAVVEILESGPIDVPHIRIMKPEVFAPSVPRTKEDGPAFFMFGFGCTAPEQLGGRFLGCRGQNSGTKEGGIIYYSINCAAASAGGFAPDPLLGDPADICAPNVKEFILSNFFKKKKPTDTCAGDSGGPVMQLAAGDSSAVPYRLVGITSRSLHPLGHCGFGGIYTKVSDPAVIGWLKDDLNINVQH
jgi:hypothetical protein